MINFETISFKNFLSVGNNPIKYELDKFQNTLIHGQNGCGKCCDGLTEIDIMFEDEATEKLFKEFLKSKRL